jgi:hypothetical protein
LLLRVLAIVWIFVVGAALLVVGVVGSWFLFIGGLFDIFSDRTLTSGIGAIDDANRDALTNYSHVAVGLVKIFVVEPLLITAVGIVLGVSNLIGAALFGASSLPRLLRRD